MALPRLVKYQTVRPPGRTAQADQRVNRQSCEATDPSDPPSQPGRRSHGPAPRRPPRASLGRLRGAGPPGRRPPGRARPDAGPVRAEHLRPDRDHRHRRRRQLVLGQHPARPARRRCRRPGRRGLAAEQCQQQGVHHRRRGSDQERVHDRWRGDRHAAQGRQQPASPACDHLGPGRHVLHEDLRDPVHRGDPHGHGRVRPAGPDGQSPELLRGGLLRGPDRRADHP